MYDLQMEKRSKPTGMELDELKRKRKRSQPNVVLEVHGLLSYCRLQGLKGCVAETESIAESPTELKDRLSMKYIM